MTEFEQLIASYGIDKVLPEFQHSTFGQNDVGYDITAMIHQEESGPDEDDEDPSHTQMTLAISLAPNNQLTAHIDLEYYASGEGVVDKTKIHDYGDLTAAGFAFIIANYLVPQEKVQAAIETYEKMVAVIDMISATNDKEQRIVWLKNRLPAQIHAIGVDLLCSDLEHQALVDSHTIRASVLGNFMVLSLKFELDSSENLVSEFCVTEYREGLPIETMIHRAGLNYDELARWVSYRLDGKGKIDPVLVERALMALRRLIEVANLVANSPLNKAA